MKYSSLVPFMLLIGCNSGKTIISTEVTEPISQIIEYTPAPGQFINEKVMGGFNGVDTPEKACEYAAERFAANNWVSLGGWGGYIIASFDKPVPNSGGYDLYVKGNQMQSSSEPGVVWVMQDTNKDGLPNDTWYELKGSEYDNAQTIRRYLITYSRPESDNLPILWSDNQGATGTIDRIDEHKQATYFPAWLEGAEITFTGTRLPDNLSYENNLYTAHAFAWGYADNFSAIDRQGVINNFRISDAVTATGEAVNLHQIDFIKVQTGVNAKAPLIGEISTEVSGIGCYRTISKVEN
jgi:hypothetical protein